MLSKEEIAFFITEDASSKRKTDAKVGQRYYEGEHDILNYKLFFYDAAAPIIEKESINMNIAFEGNRYEQERGKEEDRCGI